MIYGLVWKLDALKSKGFSFQFASLGILNFSTNPCTEKLSVDAGHISTIQMGDHGQSPHWTPFAELSLHFRRGFAFAEVCSCGISEMICFPYSMLWQLLADLEWSRVPRVQCFSTCGIVPFHFIKGGSSMSGKRPSSQGAIWPWCQHPPCNLGGGLGPLIL